MSVPLQALCIVGALVVGLGGSGAIGYAIRDSAAKAHEAELKDAADKQRQNMQEKINAVSADYEQQRQRADAASANRSQTVREYYKTVPAPASDCAPPAAMYSLLDAAANSANSAISGQSSVAVPEATQPTQPSH
jgi:hypothetical protein